MLQFEVTVTYEDGSKVDVVADQRDVAVWEVQDIALIRHELELGGHRMVPMGIREALATRTHSLYRFLAYRALLRSGKIDKGETFDAWSLRAVEVDPTGIEAAPVDPGKPAAPDAGT